MSIRSLWKGKFLGPPAFGGRYVRQLAVRSALRKKQVFAWSAALPHCLPSLGRSAVFFLWAVFFGSWAVLGPWAEAHACGSMQRAG
ncbi:hypothetical protein SGRA_4211 [Saprospira grandis str. Lewin]|uniref:Uncharacterized protein n=1 Tax=Saprospira grandis (strain Lewin) TaxID=984262 RepID=H6L7H5_SAPGL|nr:hypothetical protein SGRA_4211 [Saprospira grandis str. Lewin]